MFSRKKLLVFRLGIGGIDNSTAQRLYIGYKKVLESINDYEFVILVDHTSKDNDIYDPARPIIVSDNSEIEQIKKNQQELITVLKEWKHPTEN